MLLLSIICVSVIFGTFLMTFSPKIFLELRSSGVLTLLYLCCHPLQVKLTKYICKQLQCKQRVPERQRTQALASYPRLGDWLCTINLRPELIQVLFVHTVCVFLFCWPYEDIELFAHLPCVDVLTNWGQNHVHVQIMFMFRQTIVTDRKLHANMSSMNISLFGFSTQKVFFFSHSVCECVSRERPLYLGFGTAVYIFNEAPNAFA